MSVALTVIRKTELDLPAGHAEREREVARPMAFKQITIQCHQSCRAARRLHRPHQPHARCRGMIIEDEKGAVPLASRSHRVISTT
jgi:hypothetical protein